MDTITVKLAGLTPLLMNNPQSMRSASEENKKVGPKVIPTPEVEAAAKVYLMPGSDQLCFPSSGVRKAILQATRGQRVLKRAARPFFAGALLLLDEWFPLMDGEGTPITTYQIDVRRAVIQKAAVMRARPLIPMPWFLEGTFRFNPLINADQLRSVLTDAGLTVGLGDYRIEKDGSFGSFEVQEITVTQGVA